MNFFNRRNKPMARHPVNLDEVDQELNQYEQDRYNREVVETLHHGMRSEYVPRPKPVPMPDYVEPQADVPPVGALSAEAIVRDFEQTAKEIEAMGAELAKAANECAAELIDLTHRFKQMDDNVREIIDHVKETAASFRDEAKTVFVRIENTTLMTQDVRAISNDMRKRIGVQTPSADLLPTLVVTENKSDADHKTG